MIIETEKNNNKILNSYEEPFQIRVFTIKSQSQVSATNMRLKSDIVFGEIDR